jgi:hypothetical protein
MTDMAFFGLQPFDSAEVTYVRAGPAAAGFFSVQVNGVAQKFSFDFRLVQDPKFTGGLAIMVMGWTGPLAQGVTPYVVSGQFEGAYLKEILVIGTNKRQAVMVTERSSTDPSGR